MSLAVKQPPPRLPSRAAEHMEQSMNGGGLLACMHIGSVPRPSLHSAG